MLKRFITSIPIAFILSLFLHTSFWAGIKLSHKATLKTDQAVEIVILDQAPVTEKSKKQNQQVVEQDTKPVNDETPEDTAFLSRFNQRVVKQTKAAKSGEYTNRANPGQMIEGTPDAPQDKPKEKTADAGEIPSLNNLKPNFSLTPKADQIVKVDQLGEQSQTNDYLKDMQLGPQTLLSTREFVYFSYYQRIREKIRQQWEPRIREKVKKVFASGRSIASARDRVTQVIIVLDPGGSLIGVKVMGESGINDLDEAAVEAFKAAEPFPNPPKGIVEPDGTIKIRWDFVLEANVMPTAPEGFDVAGGHR